MRKILILLVMGLAGALAGAALNARADLEVGASVQIHATADFDAPLAAYGTWVNVGSYRRCWRPAGVAAGWQPYCNGQWVWTDCGWYWESDELWAWACYHYGFWVYDSTYGWVWIPGVDWAPAWVCWRIGDGCIGWAPLCPPGFFFAHRPIDAAFVFVDNNHFSGHIGPSVIVAGNRHDLIRRTKFISNVKFVSRDVDGHGARRVAINHGPGLGAIQKATGRQFKAVAESVAVQRTPLPSSFRPGPARNGYNHEPKSFTPAQKRGPEEGSVPPGHAGPAHGWNQGNDHGQRPGGDHDQGGGQGEDHDHGHDRGDN